MARTICHSRIISGAETRLIYFDIEKCQFNAGARALMSHCVRAISSFTSSLRRFSSEIFRSSREGFENVLFQRLVLSFESRKIGLNGHTRFLLMSDTAAR